MAEQQHKHRVGVLLFRIKCFGATEGSHVGGLDGGYFWLEKERADSAYRHQWGGRTIKEQTIGWLWVRNREREWVQQCKTNDDRQKWRHYCLRSLNCIVEIWLLFGTSKDSVIAR